jgi:hypothetical protein
MARALEERGAIAGMAGALLAAALLLVAPSARAAAQPSGKLIAGAEETVLRLHDLPPGYTIESDSGCETIRPIRIKQFRALDRWIIGARPAVCQFEYERRFRVPGLELAPPELEGETINTPSKEAATRGWKIFQRLIDRSPYLEPRGSVSVGPDGPTAKLLRRKGEDAGPIPASMLLWRHGKLLALVEAGGMEPQENDAAALQYAQVQQAHLESPSPYTEAERDDTEVMLDDPGLKFPVYWLGRTFAGGGFPPAELQTAAVIKAGGLPGAKLELRYDGFNLETWTRRSWELFQSSFFRRLNRPRCTRTYAFEWEQGHAIISAGYRRRTFDGGCPDFPPTRYWAAAHIGGVVIGVNQTTCRCLSPGSGPYSESLHGMKTILRRLTLRPKPGYSAAP